MPLTTGQLQSFVTDAARRLEGAYKDLQKTETWPNFMERMSTSLQTEREQALDTGRSLSRWTENGVPDEWRFDEGWGQAYTQQGFGARISFTKELKEYSRVDVMAVGLKYMKLAPSKTREITGATYLDFGDTAQASTPMVGGAYLINSIGGDSLTLFNTAHYWRETGNGTGAPTWANLAATYTDLTEAGLIAVYNVIAAWRDQYNAPFGINPTDIIYPVAKTSQYLKVRKSLLEPQSSGNAVNVANMLFQGGGTQEKWVQSQTDWYVKTDADAQTFGLKFYFSVMDRVMPGYDPLTFARFVALWLAFSSGANELRSIFAVKA